MRGNKGIFSYCALVHASLDFLVNNTFFRGLGPCFIQMVHYKIHSPLSRVHQFYGCTPLPTGIHACT